MPRTNIGKPKELVQLEQELREFVDGARYMTLSDISRSLGIRDNKIIYEMMRPFPAMVMPSGRKRWKLEDVARMEYQRTVS